MMVCMNARGGSAEVGFPFEAICAAGGAFLFFCSISTLDLFHTGDGILVVAGVCGYICVALHVPSGYFTQSSPNIFEENITEKP